MVQGLGEERDEGVARRGIEARGRQAQLGPRAEVRPAVARALAGQELVQDDRGRVAIGRGVRGLADLEERIAVAGRADRDRRDGQRRGREVEEGQLRAPPRVGRAQADVRGLEVTVQHARELERLERGEQIGAEDLRVGDRERALALQAPLQGLVAGQRQQQAHAAAELERRLQGDDVRVAELVEHLGLGPQALVLLGRGADLEREALAIARALDLAHARGGALAERPDDPQAGHDRVGRRVVGIEDAVLARLGRGAEVEEVRGPAADVPRLAGALRAQLGARGGGLLHVRDDLGREHVGRGARIEELIRAQPRAQLRAVSRRGAPREDQVGEGAQAEEIGEGRDGARVAGDLRRLVRGADLAEQRGAVQRRRDGLARAELEVVEANLGRTGIGLADEDGVGAERPVQDVVAMAVLERSANGEHEVDPLVEGQLGMLAKEGVEPLRAGEVVEEQRRSGRGVVDDVGQVQDPGGGRHGGERPRVAAGGALQALAQLGVGLLLREVDARAPAHRRHGAMHDEVLAVAVPLLEQLVQLVGADGRARVPRTQADLLERREDALHHRSRDDVALVPAVAAGEVAVGDGALEVAAGDHALATRVRELERDVVGGEEDERLHARALRQVLVEARAQDARLAFGQREGAVEAGRALALELDAPVDRVASVDAGTRLDLDQVELVVAEDQRVEVVMGGRVRHAAE